MIFQVIVLLVLLEFKAKIPSNRDKNRIYTSGHVGFWLISEIKYFSLTCLQISIILTEKQAC